MTLIITFSYAYFNANIDTNNNISFNQTFEDTQSYVRSYNADGENVIVTFEIKPEDMYYESSDAVHPCIKY